MPFKKQGPDDYVGPSGKHFNLDQVRLYYAGGGAFPGQKGFKGRLNLQAGTPNVPDWHEGGLPPGLARLHELQQGRYKADSPAPAFDPTGNVPHGTLAKNRASVTRAKG